MIRNPVHVALFLLLAACGSTTEEIPDLNLVNLECRVPSACFKIDCDCARATFEGCMVCDPATAPGNVCDCDSFDAGVACMTEVNVCVARGVLCIGRCVQGTGSCSTSIGSPPQTVSVANDGGANLETRCAFTDDICCTDVAPDLAAPN